MFSSFCGVETLFFVGFVGTKKAFWSFLVLRGSGGRLVFSWSTWFVPANVLPGDRGRQRLLQGLQRLGQRLPGICWGPRRRPASDAPSDACDVERELLDPGTPKTGSGAIRRGLRAFFPMEPQTRRAEVE